MNARSVKIAIAAAISFALLSPAQAQDVNPFANVTDSILAMPYFTADRAFEVLKEKGVPLSPDQERTSEQLDARISKFDPEFNRALSEGFRTRMTADNLLVDAEHVTGKVNASFEIEDKIVTALLGISEELVSLGMSAEEATLIAGGIASLIDSQGTEAAKAALYSSDSPFSHEVADNIWQKFDGISDFQRIMLDHSIIVE